MANGWIGNIWKKYCEPREIEGRLKWENLFQTAFFLFANNQSNTIYGIKLLYNCIYFTIYGISTMKSRNGLIAKIKIAQKELGMAEEAYRAMLLRITGKNSCVVMDIGELERVADEMRRFGFRMRWERRARRQSQTRQGCFRRRRNRLSIFSIASCLWPAHPWRWLRQRVVARCGCPCL